MTALRALLTALVLALLASGCGQDTVSTAVDEPPVEGGSAGPPGEPVLEVEQTGGFRPVGAAFASMPELTVLADGRAFTLGPIPAVYPGPALPNVRVHQLDPSQVAELEELARGAGLLSPPPDYGQTLVADATTTVVRLHVDSRAYEHQAYALGFAPGPAAMPGEPAAVPGEPAATPGGPRGRLQPLPGPMGGLSAEARAARERLQAFIEAVHQVVQSAGPGEAYAPEAFAVQAAPATAGDREGPVQPAVRPWPLPGVDLSAAGECVVVAGQDALTLRPVLGDADALTRFEQSGTRYAVAVRPLLPAEDGC